MGNCKNWSIIRQFLLSVKKQVRYTCILLEPSQNNLLGKNCCIISIDFWIYPHPKLCLWHVQSSHRSTFTTGLLASNKPPRHIIWICGHSKHGWQKTSKRNHVKLSNSIILIYSYTLFGDPSVDILSKTSPNPKRYFDWSLDKESDLWHSIFPISLNPNLTF